MVMKQKNVILNVPVKLKAPKHTHTSVDVFYFPFI